MEGRGSLLRTGGGGRLKLDSPECGQTFALMACSTAEMIWVCVWGVCSLLPLALGLEEGEDGRYRRLGECCASVPAVDVCTYSGLNMKCRPHTLTCLYTWSQQVALFDVVDPLGGEAAGGHESPVATDLPVTAWLWLWPKSVLSLCILAAIEISPST